MWDVGQFCVPLFCSASLVMTKNPPQTLELPLRVVFHLLTSATRTLVPSEIWGSLVSLLPCKARRATAPTVRQGFRQGFVQRPPPPPRSQSVLLKVRQLERAEGPSHGLLTSRGAHSKSAQLAKHWQVCVEHLPGIPPPSLPPSASPLPSLTASVCFGPGDPQDRTAWPSASSAPWGRRVCECSALQNATHAPSHLI